MKRFAVFIASTAFVLTIVAPANAVPLTDLNVTKQTDKASAKLLVSPTPSKYNSSSFDLSDVLVDYDGVTADYTFQFYTASAGGGFALIDNSGGYLFNEYSDVLFYGPTTAPTFNIGSFATSPRDQSSLGDGTLTIGAVPEPSSWAMIIAGFGLTGAAVRRGQRIGVSFA